jgi:hypothetical protein
VCTSLALIQEIRAKRRTRGARESPEVTLYELNIALEGSYPVQMRVYDATARFHCCMVAKIVCGFEHNPGCILGGRHIDRYVT